MKYDLNLFPAFMALMEERSVTRAAERLGVTQPALSNTLNRLRETFRDPLFVRERYGVAPTEFAQSIFPTVAAALEQFDDLVRMQQDFRPAETERLFAIAANSYVEFVLMPRLVARLRVEAPGVRLRLAPFGDDLTEAGVMSGATALALGRVVDPPDTVVVQHLMDEGLACVVRADHPDVGDTLDRATYERLKHVNVLPPGRLRAGLFQALDRQGLRRDVAISVTHFLAVPEMIAVTDHCATLPRRICRALERDPRLRIVAPPVDLGRFPVEMAWHVRHRQDAAHRWLRSVVADTAKTLEP